MKQGGQVSIPKEFKIKGVTTQEKEEEVWGKVKRGEGSLKGTPGSKEVVYEPRGKETH